MRRRLLTAALAGLVLSPVCGPAARADQVSALQAVRSQPKVIDALLDNGGNLFVSVKAERLAWDQFAAHLCKVVRPHQARIFKVRVVDVTTVAFGQPPAAWKTLGETRCGR